MEEGQSIVHWFPLRMTGVIQDLLASVGIGSLQTSPHTLWRCKGELDGGLKEVYGVLVVDFSGEPQAEGGVNFTDFCLENSLQQLL